MTKAQIATHENLEGSQVVGSSDRSFGITFTVFFLLVGLLPLVRGGRIRTWPLAVAAVFLVPSLLHPGLLAPLNRVWTRIGLLLHRVVSPVVIGVLFFTTITPMGLVMRWLGGPRGTTSRLRCGRPELLDRASAARPCARNDEQPVLKRPWAPSSKSSGCSCGYGRSSGCSRSC